MTMTLAEESERNPKRRLRLWPGVVAVLLQWLIWFGTPVVAPQANMFRFMGGFLGGGAAVLIWWLFFSRAPWLDRLGALAMAIAAVVATRPILDASIATGEMGALFFIYSIPALSFALVAGAAAGRSFSSGPRRAVLAAAILAACGLFACLRTEGVTGDFRSEFRWRWTATHEQRLLAQAAIETPSPPVQPAAAPEPVTKVPPPNPAATGDWPGFRGPNRDSTVARLRIGTGWSSSPPKQLWRRPVGPGWSSFAVGGELVYTQEQRGESEVVACYDLSTGKPLWTHRDAARFYESNAGAGPRGTPALARGLVYALGATGILNALDARTGARVWARNAAADAAVKVPTWGFAGSPLALGDRLIVAAAGRLVAYDAASGEPRWLGPDGGNESYASPHVLTIGGVQQILLLTQTGALAVGPADGALLWKHDWKGFASLQPAMTGDGGVLIPIAAEAAGAGIRRLALAQSPAGWSAQESWTSTGLKPYFNDFVVHKEHAYGFDGGILSCIDLRDGSRKWKGGRYGYGQMILLSEQDLLLVISEEGELALVSATPAQFNEIAKVPALEGKTWNHPVLAGDILLVRNGREMAAYRLPR